MITYLLGIASSSSPAVVNFPITAAKVIQSSILFTLLIFSRLLCFLFSPLVACIYFGFMYSSSNNFLGGANSARPGQPQYGFPQPQQQQQQQPGGFMSQPTGFPGGQMQPQPTGFPGGQFQPQPTGFPGQSLQPQPTGFPGGSLQPQPTGFPGGPSPQPSFQSSSLQPQFTGYPMQNQPQQPQQPQQFQQPPPSLPISAPQPTGQTSSQVAQSFQNTSSKPPEPLPTQSGSKIPNVRLSFITAQDQAKFEQLFKSAAGDGQTLDGSL